MDELQKYYEYLRKAKADVPDTYESFRNTMQDSASSRKYYEYLRANKFDTPDSYDSFINTFDLKKKEPSKAASLFGGIAGGLIGTGGDGRSVSSGLMTGIKKVKPKEKIEQVDVASYNDTFRNATGIQAQEFSLGSDLPQIKKTREE